MAPKLKDLAKENPTMIGDPVSLKSETSKTNPTNAEGGAQPSTQAPNVKDLAPTEGDIESPDKQGKQSLKERAEEGLSKGNPTMLGDPVSLKAETSDTEPTENDRGAGGKNERRSKL